MSIATKVTFIVLGIFLALFDVAFIVDDVHADYVYDNTIGSYWELSVKASTLEQKSTYLNSFVAALDSAHLSGHNALIFETPDNDYDQNLIALKSLQQRMVEIKGMDVKSFEYQQAIAQITAQEQGEADRLLGVFRGVWYKQYHPLVWNFYAFLTEAMLLIVGIVFILIGALSDAY